MAPEYEDLAKVAEKLSSYKFVINRGWSKDVRQGQRYLVFRLGSNIIDPDTEEDLGALEVVIGRAIVTHVQENIATLESDENEITPGKKRIVRRRGGSGLVNLIEGNRVEEIEEGSETKKKSIAVDIGDFVREI